MPHARGDEPHIAECLNAPDLRMPHALGIVQCNVAILSLHYAAKLLHTKKTAQALREKIYSHSRA